MDIGTYTVEADDLSVLIRKNSISLWNCVYSMTSILSCILADQKTQNVGDSGYKELKNVMNNIFLVNNVGMAVSTVGLLHELSIEVSTDIL